MTQPALGAGGAMCLELPRILKSGKAQVSWWGVLGPLLPLWSVWVLLGPPEPLVALGGWGKVSRCS